MDAVTLTVAPVGNEIDERERAKKRFGQRLRDARARMAPEKTIADVAADLKVGPDYISKVETGSRHLTTLAEKLVEQLCEYYGLDPDRELLDLMPFLNRIPERLRDRLTLRGESPESEAPADAGYPVFGLANCGPAIEAAADGRTPTGESRRVSWPGGARSKRAFVVVADGDSMHPTIAEGDELLIDPDPRVKIREGDIVLVQWEGSARVKRWHLSGQTILLVSDNPKYPAQPIVKGHFEKGHGLRWRVAQLRRTL